MYIMLPLKKMHEEINQMLAKKLRGEGRPYHETAAILFLSVFSVRSLCVYNRKHPEKCEPKYKLDNRTRLAIKRKIGHIQDSDQKIWSSRIVKDLNLNISISKVQRHMLRCGYKYKRAKSQIILSEHHKTERLNVISDWI